MSDGRLFEPTRPIGRRRRRGAASTDPRSARTTTRVKSRGRPPRGAKPPTPPPRRRRRRRINWTRITAATLCLALVAGGAWLVGGPSLRIRAVSYSGADWTERATLDAVTEPMMGRSALLVNAGAIATELGGLPGVERATVDIGLFGRVQVALVEGDAVAIWRTGAAQLLVADDGTVVGSQARDATVPGAYSELPFVDDQREASHDLWIGDQLPSDEVEAALALGDLPADRLGSASAVLRISVDPTYGFILSSPQAGWQAAMGYYGNAPQDTPATIRGRVSEQASSIRTLFAEHPEAGVAWIDARNPGRVYFRARG
jgi:cell division septal protein FtsQ